MLLDIGAKTSNLLFFEKGKVFIPASINLGANSITQDFANESKLALSRRRKKKKISEGFVSLGGRVRRSRKMPIRRRFPR